MCRRSPRRFLALLILFSLPVFAQDKSDKDPVRIGVAVLRSSTDKVSVTEARDRLVKSLNHLKPDKKLKLRLEAIPLDASDGKLALAEAKGKDCQFVLFSHLTDLLSSEKSRLSNFNTGATDTIPVLTAKVSYQLVQTADAAEYAIGSVKSEDESSARDGVMNAVGQLAGSVFSQLKTGGNVPHRETAAQPANAGASSPTGAAALMGSDSCQWLPTGIAHSGALRGVCEYAISLPQKMPNFICDQQTSRYEGDSRVPRDLITALIRYEDGKETYSDVKLNGKAAPSAISDSPGQWSRGEFGNNLRAIFDLNNETVFEFSGTSELNGHAAWVFAYRIEKQHNPLWRLRTEDRVIAPPYNGELWVDQGTGEVLRFRSVAMDIPKDFPIQSADLQTDYLTITFADGTAFPLPVAATIATRQQGEDLRRNVLQFRNCHKFQARSRMVLLQAPTSSTETAGGGSTSPEELQRQLEQEDEIYEILREQAVREDAAHMQAEQAQELDAFEERVRQRTGALEQARQKNEAALEARAKLEAAAKEEAAPSTQEGRTTLKVSVKLVQVSVVLRDPKGEAVGSLKKEDFQLFDNGKLQAISTFSAERTAAAAEAGAADGTTGELQKNVPPAAGRDVAYLFDDIHATSSDLAGATAAAARHLSALPPEDRAAIFATSAQSGVSFTADRQRLQEALKNLKPHPLDSVIHCPPMTPLMADLIVNQNDLDTLGLATKEAVNCAFAGIAHSALDMERAERVAKQTAMEVLNANTAELQSTLGVLREVVQRTAATPGTRSIVLVSPGFLVQTPSARQAVAELIDRALRANIVVNTLNVTGLTAPIPAPNASHPADPVMKARLDRDEALDRTDVLANLAYSTGGTYFHNNNDLDEGFRRTADTPEYIYVLGFSPQKLDGKFHKLKVQLNGGQKLTVQAREGYYALKPTQTP